MRGVRNKKGQSVVEFLLVSPVLIYSLFLLIIVWDICNNMIVANHAPYYFCRTLVVEESSGVPYNTARNNAKAVAQRIMPPDWDGAVHCGGGGSFVGGDSGTWDVSVDIVYSYPLPGILDFFKKDYKIHGYCLMRKIMF